MAPRPERVIAVDVGGTTIKGAVVERDGCASAVRRRPTPADAGAQPVIDAVLEFAAELGAEEPGPVALGLAVPGLVDDRAGVVLNAANLGWVDVPIRELARARLETVVAVLPHGPTCGCGRQGCLETLASASHISRRYRAMIGGEGDFVSAEEIATRAAAGEPIAAGVWGEAIDALALAIVNYAALLDPEVIVIGGGMAAAGDALFLPLRDLLRSQVRFGEPPPVVPASLGDEAGRVGAAIAAWRAVGLGADEFDGWGADDEAA